MLGWTLWLLGWTLLECEAWTTRAPPALIRPSAPSRRLAAPLWSAPDESTSTTATTNDNNNDNKKVQEVDVVVIGSGVGGLSCAALAATYGLDTVCVEAHDTPGGVAHSFDRYSSASKTIPFQFDSGPSLISGLSRPGTNPLRQVLDAIGTSNDIHWKTYDGWLVHDLADGQAFKVTVGDGDEFAQAVEQKAGRTSRLELEHFQATMLQPRGLAEASTYIPPFALRGGWAAVASLARYTLKLLSIGPRGLALTGPFSKVLDENHVHDFFVRQWFDYLAFALSGLDAAHTQTAPIVYMMRDLHTAGAVLDYPMGGMGSLIQALVSGLTNHGGQLVLNRRVEQILLDETEEGDEENDSPKSRNTKASCHGVVLDDGTVIRARRGVVCNAPLWNMARILQDSVTDRSTDAVRHAVETVQKNAQDLNMTKSFMHLHLGIPADGLPENLECHHSVLDLSQDVTAEQNMVILSIPTVFDPSLAPPGYHIVHAYTAACDSFDPWQDFCPETGKVGTSPNAGAAAQYRSQDGYAHLKQERAEVLWKAVECVIPDVRQRAAQPGAIALVGTPLTHRRYNQRFRGTYGPAPSDNQDVWELAGALTPIQDLLACGGTWLYDGGAVAASLECCCCGIGVGGGCYLIIVPESHSISCSCLFVCLVLLPFIRPFCRYHLSWYWTSRSSR